jgi:hypothetical protein
MQVIALFFPVSFLMVCGRPLFVAAAAMRHLLTSDSGPGNPTDKWFLAETEKLRKGQPSFDFKFEQRQFFFWPSPTDLIVRR